MKIKCWLIFFYKFLYFFIDHSLSLSLSLFICSSLSLSVSLSLSLTHSLSLVQLGCKVGTGEMVKWFKLNSMADWSDILTLILSLLLANYFQLLIMTLNPQPRSDLNGETKKRLKWDFDETQMRPILIYKRRNPKWWDIPSRSRNRNRKPLLNLICAALPSC
jgi:hypothetical protein